MTKQKKIQLLLLSNLYPCPDYPGYGGFVARMAHSLDKSHFDVKKIVMRKFPSKLTLLFGYALYIYRAVREINKGTYDICYFHYGNHSLLPLLFIRQSIASKIVINFHGTDFTHDGLFPTIIRRLLKRKTKCSNLLVAPSKYFKSLLVDYYNIGLGSVVVSHSGGVDSSIFRNYFRFQRLRSGITRFVFAGRIDPGKGLELLISACKILVASCQSFELVIAGVGSSETMVRREISTFENIHYVGYLNQDELYELYADCDFFVFPTVLDESLGLAPIEALQSGLPCISTPFNSGKEYLFDSKNSFVAFDKSVDAFAGVMSKAINLPNSDYCLMSRSAIETTNIYRRTIVSSDLQKHLFNLVNYSK